MLRVLILDLVALAGCQEAQHEALPEAPGESFQRWQDQKIQECLILTALAVKQAGTDVPEHLVRRAFQGCLVDQGLTI